MCVVVVYSPAVLFDALPRVVRRGALSPAAMITAARGAHDTGDYWRSLYDDTNFTCLFSRWVFHFLSVDMY